MVAEECAVWLLSAQPHLREIVESPVFVNFLRGDVAVIIDKRERCGVIVVQAPGGFIFEKKVISHELFHTAFLRAEPPQISFALDKV